MKKLLIISAFVLFIITGIYAREKKETIGKLLWYTEQNNFEEMVRIAKKANKPILAVFSATWCRPCQRIKRTVFKTEQFKKVADNVVLLYVEQTTKEGAAYNKKYKIGAFPTFKIFSKEGIMLDTGHPKRTVDGFLEWIQDVKSGNNFYELSKKIKKNPYDRESLIKIVDKLGWLEGKEKIRYLNRAVKIKPDFNDELSHKAYEKLGFYLAQDIPYKEGAKKREYLKNNLQLFQKIMKAYYPDKFKYELKGNFGLLTIIHWYNESKKFKKALEFFNDFIKRKGKKLDLLKDINVIYGAISAYIGLERIDDAEKWILKVKNYSKGDTNLKKDRNFVFYYFRIFRSIIDYFGKKKQVKETEKYAGFLFEEMSLSGQVGMKDYLMQEYATKYGIFTAKTLKNIEEKLKTTKGAQRVKLISNKAKIYSNMGKKKEARKFLVDLYESKEYFKSLKKKAIPSVLNTIAWTMVELKIVDQKSLEIAKKAMSLNASSMIMDTLACVYAELGNYKEAIKIERDVIKKVGQEFEKQEYLEKINKWQKKIR